MYALRGKTRRNKWFRVVKNPPCFGKVYSYRSSQDNWSIQSLKCNMETIQRKLGEQCVSMASRLLARDSKPKILGKTFNSRKTSFFQSLQTNIRKAVLLMIFKGFTLFNYVRRPTARVHGNHGYICLQRVPNKVTANIVNPNVLVCIISPHVLVHRHIHVHIMCIYTYTHMHACGALS